MRPSSPLRCLAPLVALALTAGAAQAKLPYPPNCEVPRVLVLVGRDAGGTPDPLGEFRVVARDIINAPMMNCMVVVDLSTSDDARISIDQQPTATAICSSRWVYATGYTDAQGVASLRVVGRADHLMPASTEPRLRVYVDGVTIGIVRVAAFDHDGGGVGAPDLALWAEDYFAGTHPARSDYDGDGAVTSLDLALWAGAFFAAGSVHGGEPDCP